MKYIYQIGLCATTALAITACTAAENLDIGTSSAGEACGQTFNCVAGYICEDKTCVKIVDPEINPFKGIACSSDSDCCEDSDNDGSCLGENGLLCGPQKRCSYSGNSQKGDSCSLDVDCGYNGSKRLICSGDTSTCVDPECVPKKDNTPGCEANPTGIKDFGDSCANINDCRRPYICSMVGVNPTCVKMPFFAGADCTASDREAGAFRVYYEVPVLDDSSTEKQEFYRHPFPSDVRSDNGKINLDNHPSPGEVMGIDVAGRYIKSAKESATGFALNQPVFFRTTDFPKKSSICLDEGSIYPELADGDSDAFCQDGGKPSIYLVNIDPDSDNYGKHIPVELKLEKEASQFICQNSIALAPLPGRPLEPNTTYAAVITTAIRDIRNQAPIQDAAFKMTLHPETATANTQKAVAVMAPLVEWLNKNNIALDSIAGATVFTTGTPTDTGKKLYEAIYKLPAPVFDDGAINCETETVHVCHGKKVDNSYLPERSCSSTPSSKFYEIHGSYTAPLFQHGTRPYMTEGGNFTFDSNGLPVKASDETMCYTLTIPKDMDKPAAGWPVIIYAHGTGGNYRSFVSDQLIGIYTELGFAVISFDNVMHGPRQDSSMKSASWHAELWDDDNAGNLFFNPINPQASRDNILQGSADLISLTRLVATGAPTVAGVDISFDPENIFYLGHSQGTTINPAYLMNDPHLKAAILSGAGAELTISVLHKTEPINIGASLGNLFGDQRLTHIHPIMGIMDMLFAEVDALSYANYFVHNPSRSKNDLPLLMFWGIGDSYSPNEAQASLVKAMGVPLLLPVDIKLDQVPTVTGTVTQTKLDGYTANVPAATLQYTPTQNENGHFVLFYEEEAKEVLKHFLSTTLAGSPEIKR